MFKLHKAVTRNVLKVTNFRTKRTWCSKQKNLVLKICDSNNIKNRTYNTYHAEAGQSHHHYNTTTGKHVQLSTYVVYHNTGKSNYTSKEFNINALLSWITTTSSRTIDTVLIFQFTHFTA